MNPSIQRRQFSVSLLGLACGAAGGSVALPALGQPNVPIEGTHYVRLSTPVATSSPGKIEVIEFFWYGCPHCNALEPALDSWARALPADVAFRRVPTAFSEAWEPHQRIFYALESMNLVEAMHRKVFYAIHVKRMRLDRPADIVAFMASQGVDAAQFTQAYNSFGVVSKVRQATQLVNAYKIDGVPAIGVNGRFYTTGALAGSNERSLLVADYLIGRIRKPV